MPDKYLLNHSTGEYQLNLSVPLNEFIKQLGEGKDMLTLFNLDGSYAGVVAPTFLYECEIFLDGVKLEMGERQFFLQRSEDLATFFIHIASILQKATQKKELISHGNKISFRHKNEDEIFDFNWDYDSVIHKYLDFVHETWRPSLPISKQEMELLQKSAHAAHYLMTEGGNKAPELVERIYNEYFKSDN